MCVAYVHILPRSEHLSSTEQSSTQILVSKHHSLLKDTGSVEKWLTPRLAQRKNKMAWNFF